MSAPRILFAWELGAHFGHAATIAEIVRALDGRAEVFLAARKPENVRSIAPDLKARLLPAPAIAVRPPRSNEDRGVSYPDDLRHVGWSDPETLSALMECWESLYDLVRPDLIVAQAAPTALLAARGRGETTATVGSGYDMPPRVSPMPPFAFWREDLRAPVQEREARVLATANEALKRRGKPPLAAFADALRSDLTFLATFAEIDHYAPRARFEPDHPPYLGQLFTIDAGVELDWRKGAARRIFAYLRPGGPVFDAAVEALAARPAEEDAILAAPGAPEAVKARLRGTAVRLIDGPVRLDRLLPDCDIGVSHGSNGVAAAFLASATKQLCLPTHGEQLMIARAIGDAGYGLGIAGGYGAKEIGESLDKLAAATTLTARLEAAAARMAEIVKTPPQEKIAEAILAALR